MPRSNPMNSAPLAVVLAAGQGTRMKSDLPKVLCPVNGRPMIEYVLQALRSEGVQKIVTVVGYRANLVRETLGGWADIDFVEQTERLGTGHAVKMALPMLRRHHGTVIVVAGDSPMLQARSVGRLLEAFYSESPACLLGTLHKQDPHGLGRIVRDADGNFSGIVEEKDATPEQRGITEVNMSTYIFDAQALVHALEHLQNHNQQREYYLTDCPGILCKEKQKVLALPILEPCEALSINTPDELRLVEEKMSEMGYN